MFSKSAVLYTLGQHAVLNFILIAKVASKKVKQGRKCVIQRRDAATALRLWKLVRRKDYRGLP